MRIEKKVAKARSKMGVGKEQPSIMSKLKRVPKRVANTQEWVECPVSPEVFSSFGVGNASMEEPGDDGFEIASRIGVCFDEVRGKSMKTWAPSNLGMLKLSSAIRKCLWDCQFQSGEDGFENASRTGVSLGEVRGSSLKTLGTQQPQECLNLTLPVGNGFGVGNSVEKTGEDGFEIASRIWVSLTK